MPDYKLRLWDEGSFDVESVPFVSEAFKAKKWAFIADYVRLFALFHEGGIYLDSDVRVFRPFDEFLGHGFVSSHEFHPFNHKPLEDGQSLNQTAPHLSGGLGNGVNILSAIMGCAPQHPYVRDCMRFYERLNFLDQDGKMRCGDLIIGPFISKIAERYGYQHHLGRQVLADNMVIFEPEVFVGNSAYLRSESYASHLCNGSWKDRPWIAERLHRAADRFPALRATVQVLQKVNERTGRWLQRR